jgi:hypothetical protein
MADMVLVSLPKVAFLNGGVLFILPWRGRVDANAMSGGVG